MNPPPAKVAAAETATSSQNKRGLRPPSSFQTLFSTSAVTRRGRFLLLLPAVLQLFDKGLLVKALDIRTCITFIDCLPESIHLSRGVIIQEPGSGRYNTDTLPLINGFSILPPGYKSQIISAQLFRCFDQGLKFTVTGAWGQDVIRHLDKFSDFLAFARYEVHLLVASRMIIEQGILYIKAPANEFHENHILQLPAAVLGKLKRTGVHKTAICHIHFLWRLLHPFELFVIARKIPEQIRLCQVPAELLYRSHTS